MSRNLTAFLLICLLCLSGNGYPQQAIDINKVKTELQGTLTDSARLEKLQDAAWYYTWADTSIMQASAYAEEAILLAKAKKISIGYKLYWVHAEILNRQKNFLAAYYELAMAKKKYYESTAKTKHLRIDLLSAELMTNMGAFYEVRDTYENILSGKVENISDSLKTVVHLKLAATYFNLNTGPMAQKHYQAGIDLSLQGNYPGAAADGYYGLGNVSLLIDSNYTASLGSFKKSLHFALQSKDSTRIVLALRRLAWNHYILKNYDSAIYHYNRVVPIASALQIQTTVANAYSNLGSIYRDKGDFAAAGRYFEKGIGLCLAINDLYDLGAIYLDMSKMYERQGNITKAYECLLLNKRYNDLYMIRNPSSGYVDAQVKYQTFKKERDLENLSNTLQQHQFFTYALAAALVLFLIIGILLYRQFRMNAKRKISDMNHQISEITQKNLRQQMNPHFIFNTLNSIQYYMYQHDKIATNEYLTKFSSLMRKILDNSEQTTVSIKEELDALQLYLELEQLRFKDKFSFILKIDENIDTLDYKIPTMFIQPFVENAIGHGLMHRETGGLLQIQLLLRDDFFECIIEDNGIGREASKEINRKKQPDHQSLGIKITQSRLNLVNTLYGKSMRIEYTDLKAADGTPAGTKVIIHIPMMT
ncbi:MAG: histidine kinase [Ignavibacteriales bacterium]|nr:histidine kinase [Ignavibacteriales bacterium]